MNEIQRHKRSRAAISNLSATTWDTTVPLVGSQYSGNRHCRLRKAPVHPLPQFTVQHSRLKLQVNLGLQESTNQNWIWWSSNTLPFCWFYYESDTLNWLVHLFEDRRETWWNHLLFMSTPPLLKAMGFYALADLNLGALITALLPSGESILWVELLQRVSKVQVTFPSQRSCFNKLFSSVHTDLMATGRWLRFASCAIPLLEWLSCDHKALTWSLSPTWRVVFHLH